MLTATLNYALALPRFLPAGFEVHVAWSWADRAWGLCTTFAELGNAALVLGPLQIHADWDIA